MQNSRADQTISFHNKIFFQCPILVNRLKSKYYNHFLKNLRILVQILKYGAK